MYQLYKGRPKDGREDKEEKVYDLLDGLNIEYSRVDHEPLFTIEACQKVDEVLGFEICKNLFLVNSNRTKYYMLLMMPNKSLSTKDLKLQINSSRLSFGSSEQLLEKLNLTPGSVNVCALMFDKDNSVQLLVDEDILKQEYFGFHSMINTSTVTVKTSEVFEKILPVLNHLPTIVKIP